MYRLWFIHQLQKECCCRKNTDSCWLARFVDGVVFVHKYLLLSTPLTRALSASAVAKERFLSSSRCIYGPRAVRAIALPLPQASAHFCRLVWPAGLATSLRSETWIYPSANFYPDEKGLFPGPSDQTIKKLERKFWNYLEIQECCLNSHVKENSSVLRKRCSLEAFLIWAFLPSFFLSCAASVSWEFC